MDADFGCRLSETINLDAIQVVLRHQSRRKLHGSRVGMGDLLSFFTNFTLPSRDVCNSANWHGIGKDFPYYTFFIRVAGRETFCSAIMQSAPSRASRLFTVCQALNML